jgi:hypothetical protein
MNRLVAILVTLFLVAIPAKADVALWPRVPGWTVIKVDGEINLFDLDTFQRYTENVDPDTTLVIVTGPGGNLSAGIRMGIRVHQKKLIIGAMGMCSSSCALIWIGGEIGRKFLFQQQGTGLCFHQASNPVAGPDGDALPGPSSGPGNESIGKYLTYLGYKRDMIEWAITAGPKYRLCLNPELAKKFNFDFWYNTEDGQHYTLPGDHGSIFEATFDSVASSGSGIAPAAPMPLLPSSPPAPPLSPGGSATLRNPSTSLPNGQPANPAAPLTKEELEREAFTRCMYLNEIRKRACKEDFLKGTQR